MPFPVSGWNTPLPKIDLSDDHLKAIGRATVEWSRLEEIVETTVWRFARLELDSQDLLKGREIPLGSALTAHLRLDAWLGQISSLSDAVLKQKSLLNRIAYLIKDTRKLQTNRNILIHARWKPHSGTYAIHAVTARAKIVSGFYIPTLRDIEMFWDTTEVLANRWSRLRYDLTVPVAYYYQRI